MSMVTSFNTLQMQKDYKTIVSSCALAERQLPAQCVIAGSSTAASTAL